MPTVISHAIVAVAAGYAGTRHRQPRKFWFLAVGCSLLPDADVAAFLMGIPYEHPFGHRGFFHSLFFALLVGLIVALGFFREIPLASSRKWFYFAFFFLITSSHGILDAFTDGGLGVALLAPFDNSRFFFYWTPIEVSPIGFGRLLSERGLVVLASELLWIWVPAIFLAFSVRLLRARRSLGAYK